MNKNSENIIGIVGGVGPYAGLDLMKKILGETAVNPAIALFETKVQIFFSIV